MAYEVEVTEEFKAWYEALSAEEQESIRYTVGLLADRGPALGRPHADTLKGARFPNLKELRVQHAGRPFRILFAFDPRRVALLLIGGDKTGNKDWYITFLALAEKLYAAHLRDLEE